MAEINGFQQKQVQLVANTSQKVVFATGVQELKVSNMGIDKVAYIVNGTPSSVDDVNSNFLTEDKYRDVIFKERGFTEITFISSGTPIIQWDSPESE